MITVDLNKPEEAIFYLMVDQKRKEAISDTPENDLIRGIIEDCNIVERKTNYWMIIYSVIIFSLSAFVTISAFDFTPVVEDAIRGKCSYNPPSNLYEMSFIVGVMVVFLSLLLLTNFMNDVVKQNLFARKLKDYARTRISFF